MAERIYKPNGTSSKRCWRKALNEGERYGLLTVLAPIKIISSKTKLLCKCDCGEERWADRALLIGGNMTSCRTCAKVRQHIGGWNKAHGLSETPEHRSWYGAMKRCTDPSNESWHNYGGRGITMCQRWQDDFMNFLADMGKRPKNTSLDRIDNERGYSPDNCRWATRRVQILNRRGIIFTTVNGREIAAADIAKKTGLESKWIRDLITKKGMSGDQIVEKAIRALEKLRKNR